MNLASRLASRAEGGQVLADPRTAGVVGTDDRIRFEKFEAAELKGFARPVTLYAVEGAADPSVAGGDRRKA